MALIDGLKTLYNSIFLNNDLLIRRLRKLGVAIGDDVTFYCPKETTVDIQNPHLPRRIPAAGQSAALPESTASARRNPSGPVRPGPCQTARSQ